MDQKLPDLPEHKRRDYSRLTVSLLFAPLGFAAAMMIGTAVGIELERVIIYPALLAVVYPIAIFLGVNRIALWVALAVMPLAIIPNVVRSGGAILTPLGVVVVLAMIAITFHGLMAVWQLLNGKTNRWVAAGVALLIPYAILAGIGMAYEVSPTLRYWLAAPSARLGLAFDNNWAERYETQVHRISDPDRLARELCLAARVNNAAFVNIVLRAGGDPNRTVDGRTAIECAEEARAADATSAIRAHGNATRP